MTTKKLQKVQDHIKDLLKQIEQAEADLRMIDKLQSLIDSGHYYNKTNINGKPIQNVEDVANYPSREEITNELYDLKYELKLFRQKEYDLIKEVTQEI